VVVLEQCNVRAWSIDVDAHEKESLRMTIMTLNEPLNPKKVVISLMFHICV
jgi:hypothetical protein